MLDERKLSVLRAIVAEYVASHEPVGSRVIAERHVPGVSSATIRNDMATLEEEGLIHAPHTSAGRVPTDKGYRLFVDKLSKVKPLSPAERTAISRFLEGAVDLDDIMLRTTKVLAQLTQQVAIVQYPSLQLSAVRHIELVGMPGRRAMVVIIADTGRVEQRVVDLGTDLGAVSLEELRQRFNQLLAGKMFSEVPALLGDLLPNIDPAARPAAAAITACLLEALVDHPEDRLVVAGTAHLARRRHELDYTMAPLLEVLEEQVVLLRLMGEVAAADAVQVRIGSENQLDSLAGAAVVATSYGSAEHTLGRLAVLGSTHMDYAGSIAAVTAVANYVGKIVAEV